MNESVLAQGAQHLQHDWLHLRHPVRPFLQHCYRAARPDPLRVGNAEAGADDGDDDDQRPAEVSAATVSFQASLS